MLSNFKWALLAIIPVVITRVILWYYPEACQPHNQGSLYFINRTIVPTVVGDVKYIQIQKIWRGKMSIIQPTIHIDDVSRGSYTKEQIQTFLGNYSSYTVSYLPYDTDNLPIVMKSSKPLTYPLNFAESSSIKLEGIDSHVRLTLKLVMNIPTSLMTPFQCTLSIGGQKFLFNYTPHVHITSGNALMFIHDHAEEVSSNENEN